MLLCETVRVKSKQILHLFHCFLSLKSKEEDPPKFAIFFLIKSNRQFNIYLYFVYPEEELLEHDQTAW